MEDTVMEIQVLHYERETKEAITQVDMDKSKMRETQKMLREELQKDEQYKQLDKDAKEMAKRAKQRREQLIQSDASLQGLESQIEQFKSEVKEDQLTLDTYLDEFTRVNGKYQIKGEDGKMRNIVKKLAVKKNE